MTWRAMNFKTSFSSDFEFFFHDRQMEGYCFLSVGYSSSQPFGSGAVAADQTLSYPSLDARRFLGSTSMGTWDRRASRRIAAHFGPYLHLPLCRAGATLCRL